MKTKINQPKAVNRRLLMLGGIKAALMGVIFGRLYYLQVIQSEKYTILSDQNRINSMVLAPERGRLLDRHGTPISLNVPTYVIEMVMEGEAEAATVLQRVQSLTSLSDDRIRDLQKKQHHQRSYLASTILEDITWEELARVELNLPDLGGVAVAEQQKRHYPFGGMAANILGYVAPPSKDEVEKTPLFAQPGFRVGKSGLEKQYDDRLQGTAGIVHQEVNASGRVVRELDRLPAISGADLRTNVDIAIQSFAYQRLSSQLSGAAVVLDVESGDVIAMASMPGYDPSLFYRGIDRESWRDLSSNEYRPLINKATSGLYAPGSTFKPMTALAILRAGIKPTERVTCTGAYTLGNARFHCWKRGGHGSVDMIGALQHSCDVYFYDMSRRVGIDAIAEVANSFGLGSETEIDIPGEQAGTIPTTQWKKSAFGESWQPGETLVSAIGQGFVLATPVQLALMTARLANGGTLVAPRFVRSDTPMPSERLDIPGEHLQVVKEGMWRVTNDPKGTAYSSRIGTPGMEMAGKTGTSQVRRITMRERSSGVVKNDDLPWAKRDHALFVAYAPVQKPKFSCAVIVEHGGGGSAVAAPIARDILIECQMRAFSSLRPPTFQRR